MSHHNVVKECPYCHKLFRRNKSRERHMAGWQRGETVYPACQFAPVNEGATNAEEN